MTKWTIDPDHSVAAFSIRHMMVAHVRGQFNQMSGTILRDEDDATKSSMEMTIDVNSITTGIKKRDDHLKSEDFFDAAKHPSMTFKSSKVVLTGLQRAKVAGDLTIHGVTRPVTFDVEFAGPVKSPFGETTMGFTAETEISRADFGMTWNEPMEMGGVMVGNEVQLTVDIEADMVSE